MSGGNAMPVAAGGTFIHCIPSGFLGIVPDAAQSGDLVGSGKEIPTSK
jgi:hypothetical protein